MYCKNCGKQIENDATFCKYCGTKVNEIVAEKKVESKPTYQHTEQNRAESPVIGILSIIFSFFIAIIGCILGIIGLQSYKEKPNITNCKIGLVISIVSIILEVIAIFAYTAAISNGSI